MKDAFTTAQSQEEAARAAAEACSQRPLNACAVGEGRNGFAVQYVLSLSKLQQNGAKPAPTL